MSRTLHFTLLGTALTLLAGCSAAPQSNPKDSADGKPATGRSASAETREDVAITVYNQNFGLVREIRRLDLGTGRVELEFADVAEHLQPQTVHIKPLGGSSDLTILEQNYRYDVLAPNTLLDNFKGRFAFPDVPDELIPEPTLVWLLDSAKPKQRVEVSYLTQNINWSSDYVFVVNQDDTRGDLTGWVTLNNQTGTSFENAKLKLVAGDVQRTSPPANNKMFQALAAASEAKDEDGFQEEGFFEYHLYTLGRRTTLREKEQKQVTLLESKDAKIDKQLIFYGAQHYYRGRYGQIASNQKVGVYLDIKNSKANGLGVPLPKGVIRVYKADKSGSKQFIGEDSIDHTPRDEEVRIKLGDAFDVVGDRKQTKWTALGRCGNETSWEIELRNHKDSEEKVIISEPVGGDWEIVASSHPHHKKDAHRFVFNVAVPANGKTTVTYTVQTRWC